MTFACECQKILVEAKYPATGREMRQNGKDPTLPIEAGELNVHWASAHRPVCAGERRRAPASATSAGARRKRQSACFLLFSTRRHGHRSILD